MLPAPTTAHAPAIIRGKFRANHTPGATGWLSLNRLGCGNHSKTYHQSQQSKQEHQDSQFPEKLHLASPPFFILVILNLSFLLDYRFLLGEQFPLFAQDQLNLPDQKS